MAKIPRWYQNEAINGWWADATTRKGNPIIVLPTGAGKSLVLAELIKGILTKYPRQRILVLTHVKELIEQDVKALVDQWSYAPLCIYSASVGQKKLDKPVVFAGIQSIVKVSDEELPEFDLVFVDECQLIGPDANTAYQVLRTRLIAKRPKCKFTGLTATPYRLKGGHLLDCGLFTHICYDLTTPDSFSRLVGEGYLSRLVTKFSVTKYDTSGVSERGGEYVDSELNSAVESQRDTTEHAVREMIASGRNYCLVFATSIAHAEYIKDILNKYGEDAAVVHGKLKKKERESLLNRFKDKQLKWLVNVNVLTTGFDAPHIDLIGVLRPTKSVGLWVQILGRGLRIDSGKINCLIMDFTDNTMSLGPIDDPAAPTRGKKKKRGGGGGGFELVSKICKGKHTSGEACERVCGITCRTCPDCGYEFDMKDPTVFGVASSEEVMGTGIPQIDDFIVSTVNYSLFQREGKPDSVKVVYYIGLQYYYKWLNPEAAGSARKMFEVWWKRASGGTEPPFDCSEFIQRRSELSQPTAIKVWLKKPYPEVLNYDYGDGFEGAK